MDKSFNVKGLNLNQWHIFPDRSMHTAKERKYFSVLYCTEIPENKWILSRNIFAPYTMNFTCSWTLEK